MASTHRKHFAVERLPEQGQEAVRRGLAEGLTLEAVAAAVEQACGETISTTAIHNWSRWQHVQQRYAERQAAIDTATQLVSAIADDRFIRALNQQLKTRLMDRETELDQLPATDLLDQVQRMEKLELEHKRMAIEDRRAKADGVKAIAAEKGAEARIVMADAYAKRVDLLERQLEATKRQLEEVAAKADGEGKVSVDAVRQVVADIYGIELKVAAAEVPGG